MSKPNQFKKINLGIYPTPLHPSRKFAQLFFKREDLSGFSLGGNKVRSAEYLLADAISRKAKQVIISGNTQSNYVRIMATACRVLNLRPILVSYGSVPDSVQGNWKLIKPLIEEVYFTNSDDRSTADPLAQRIYDKYNLQNQISYLIPRGGATAVASLGFSELVSELKMQCENQNIKIKNLVFPVGSGATIAGILAGVSANQLNWNVIGICTSRPREESLQTARRLALEVLSLQGLDLELSANIEIYDEVNPMGYGKWGRPIPEIIVQTLIEEGMPLDPIFGAKGYEGLFKLYSKKTIGLNEPTVYITCGGSPSLFLNHLEL